MNLLMNCEGQRMKVSYFQPETPEVLMHLCDSSIFEFT